MDNIDIIFDELKRNEIDIDKQTLSFHINTMINKHRDIYRETNTRDLNLEQIYREINVKNFGEEVKPKTWRIFRQNDAISMTTLTLFSW
jgi:hypothetical protein